MKANEKTIIVGSGETLSRRSKLAALATIAANSVSCSTEMTNTQNDDYNRSMQPIRLFIETIAPMILTNPYRHLSNVVLPTVQTKQRKPQMKSKNSKRKRKPKRTHRNKK